MASGASEIFSVSSCLTVKFLSTGNHLVLLVGIHAYVPFKMLCIFYAAKNMKINILARLCFDKITYWTIFLSDRNIFFFVCLYLGLLRAVKLLSFYMLVWYFH